MNMKDVDNDKDNDQQAVGLDLPYGLDPKINYPQKFKYAPADLYPRHYKK